MTRMACRDLRAGNPRKPKCLNGDIEGPDVPDGAMRAPVLVILCEGERTLEVYENDAAAWNGLLDFVNHRWSRRFGLLVPPRNDEQRAQAFFREDELYFVASATLSVLDENLNDSAPSDLSPQT